jgi:hypothetical protein
MAERTRILPIFVIWASAAFCFIAVFDLPYGFYLLLRWVVCGVAVAGAFEFYAVKKFGWVWGLGVLAVLFNPILKVHFEKEIWRVIDSLAGIILSIAGYHLLALGRRVDRK